MTGRGTQEQGGVRGLWPKRKPGVRLGRVGVWMGALLLLASPVLAAKGTLSESEIVDLFSQGKTLFSQANETAGSDQAKARELYRQSVLRFERIVREGGVRNGKLYYDIGNVHFRMNDVGRAILNYRRAELYIPNDPNLHQNLDYARARRVDRIGVPEKTRILKTVFFWHYDLSTRGRMILFLTLFVAAWLLAAVRLLTRRHPAVWMLWCVSLGAILLLGSLAADAIALERHKAGVILGVEVVARKGDSAAYEPSFKEPLHAGTEFVLVENRGDWFQIELSDGLRCWVPNDEAGLVR